MSKPPVRGCPQHFVGRAPAFRTTVSPPRSRRVLADPAAFRALSDSLDTGGAPTAVRLNLFPDVVAESMVEWAD